MSPSEETEVFEALFEHSSTPMALIADDGRYRAVNGAACELLGRSRERLLDMRIADVTVAATPDSVARLWEAFLENGSQVGQLALKRADGSQINVSYSATANIVPGLHLAIFLRTGRDDSAPPAIRCVRPQQASAVLTAREREVMSMFAHGATGPEIAEALSISPEGVRSRTRSARKKLGARTRSHAIALVVGGAQIDI